MRSVMFVCLTAGISVSLLLLLVSNAAGGEDGTQDDSSLPTWSRKLPQHRAEEGGGEGHKHEDHSTEYLYNNLNYVYKIFSS